MELGRVDYADGHWIVADLKPHVSMRFKDVFKGIRFGDLPPYILQDREDRAADLDWFMSRYPLTVTDRAAGRLAAGLAAYRAGQGRLEALQAPDYRPMLLTGFRPGEKARRHQLRAAEMLRQTGRLLLLDEVGLGKTVSALAAVSDGWGLPAAIIVQPHLSGQWIADYIRRFTDLRAEEVTDRSPRTLPPADVYVFRYSNVAAWADYAETLGCRTVIFDEVQELRHGRSTDKGRGCAAFAAAASYRLGLTATPIYNYGSEILERRRVHRPGRARHLVRVPGELVHAVRLALDRHGPRGPRRLPAVRGRDPAADDRR
ncbi:MAG: SNF2-related protein [Amaricoccus sp.]|uniref:SNF2-related protein n=1 Tax=Amaricoccus sp. TaxID=1872485 RepID=UPI0039E2531A